MRKAWAIALVVLLMLVTLLLATMAAADEPATGDTDHSALIAGAAGHAAVVLPATASGEPTFGCIIEQVNEVIACFEGQPAAAAVTTSAVVLSNEYGLQIDQYERILLLWRRVAAETAEAANYWDEPYLHNEAPAHRWYRG